MVDAQLVAAIASEGSAHATDAASCARILRRLRVERELAGLQREIDRLQELGASQHDSEINTLGMRKRVLRGQLDDLI